jgi:hypothetical protein
VKVKRSLGTKYALFILPAITVMREGLEAVVFLGGVSLGEAGTSIPIAAICGLLAGLLVGYLLYKSSSRLSKYSVNFCDRDEKLIFLCHVMSQIYPSSSLLLLHSCYSSELDFCPNQLATSRPTSMLSL